MTKEYVCSANEIEVNGAPTEIKILPLGMVHSQKGDFIVDKESFVAINNNFQGRKLDLVIDYEHQTLLNEQAPAGGWIKELSLLEDAIVAKVEWTKKAEEYLKNKEYRYLSPVVNVRQSDNKAIKIHSLALTNTPAIDGMFAIVNGSSIHIGNLETESELKKTGGNKMELEKLVKLLGLEENADEATVEKALLEKLNGMKEDEKTEEKEVLVANSTIMGLLGLKENAKTEEVAATILSLKNTDNTVQEQLEKLTEKMAKREAEEVVELALKAGKISANQREWATTYALKDPEGFQSFSEMAVSVVPMGKMDTVDAPKTDKTNVDIKILKNQGFSEEEIKKITEKKED